MDIRITHTYLVPRIYEVPVVKYKITSKSIKAYFNKIKTSFGTTKYIKLLMDHLILSRTKAADHLTVRLSCINLRLIGTVTGE